MQNRPRLFPVSILRGDRPEINFDQRKGHITVDETSLTLEAAIRPILLEEMGTLFMSVNFMMISEIHDAAFR